MKGQLITLRPQDVCVALQLCLTPEVAFRDLAKSVAMSLGETHNATQRLRSARLVLVDRSVPNRPGLAEFLQHGVPYAFPGVLGPVSRGVPTAHSGPVLAAHLSGDDPVVWPHRSGNVRGATLAPLCPSAPSLADDNSELYELLTLVDALRVGRARERALAIELLRASILAHDE